MTGRDILTPAAMLAILRREETVRGVAERFGVTEAQVLEWTDVFVVGGVLALTDYRNGRLHIGGSPRQYGSTKDLGATTTQSPDRTTEMFERTTSVAAVPATTTPSPTQDWDDAE